MKPAPAKVIIGTAMISIFSCTEVNKRVDEKVRLLDKRAGQLDSMLTNELKKVQQLDTIIHDEIQRARQLDSIIQKSRGKIDSVLNKR